MARKKRYPKKAKLLQEFKESAGLLAPPTTLPPTQPPPPSPPPPPPPPGGAKRVEVINEALHLLDDMLAIGPQGDWTSSDSDRLAELAELAEPK